MKRVIKKPRWKLEEQERVDQSERHWSWLEITPIVIQLSMLILAIFAYFYTVIPLYERDLLVEQKSLLETQIQEIQGGKKILEEQKQNLLNQISDVQNKLEQSRSKLILLEEKNNVFIKKHDQEELLEYLLSVKNSIHNSIERYWKEGKTAKEKIENIKSILFDPQKILISASLKTSGYHKSFQKAALESPLSPKECGNLNHRYLYKFYEELIEKRKLTIYKNFVRSYLQYEKQNPLPKWGVNKRKKEVFLDTQLGHAASRAIADFSRNDTYYPWSEINSKLLNCVRVAGDKFNLIKNKMLFANDLALNKIPDLRTDREAPPGFIVFEFLNDRGSLKELSNEIDDMVEQYKNEEILGSG